MHCPIDNTELVMTDRQGVEIDYCPKCRGVWLDRGELDKILERSADPAPSRPENRPSRMTSSDETREVSSGGFFDKVTDREDDDDRKVDRHGRTKKKKGSFLEDLFDF